MTEAEIQALLATRGQPASGKPVGSKAVRRGYRDHLRKQMTKVPTPADDARDEYMEDLMNEEWLQEVSSQC